MTIDSTNRPVEKVSFDPMVNSRVLYDTESFIKVLYDEFVTINTIYDANGFLVKRIDIPLPPITFVGIGSGKIGSTFKIG